MVLKPYNGFGADLVEWVDHRWRAECAVCEDIYGRIYAHLYVAAHDSICRHARSCTSTLSNISPRHPLSRFQITAPGLTHSFNSYKTQPAVPRLQSATMTNTPFESRVGAPTSITLAVLGCGKSRRVSARCQFYFLGLFVDQWTIC